MPFGEYSLPPFPIVNGEYTSLLLQDHREAPTPSASRTLYFDEDTTAP
jgi:hypothetical protein